MPSFIPTGRYPSKVGRSQLRMVFHFRLKLCAILHEMAVIEMVSDLGGHG